RDRRKAVAVTERTPRLSADPPASDKHSRPAGHCSPSIITVPRSGALGAIEVHAWLRDESATEIQPTSTRLRFGEGPVFLFLAWSEKVHDPLASGMQELSDQASVAAPPECLRAHQANGRLRERRCQCLLPARRAHA